MASPRTAERLLARIDWSSLQAAGGNGDRVGRALSELLAAASPEAATEAYWRIENSAFVQHDLYEVAECCTSVLMASLLDPRERWVRILALELLFWILGAYPSPPTPPDLRERCHRIAREGLWLLIREVFGEHRDAAFEILERLDEEDGTRRLAERAAELERASVQGSPLAERVLASIDWSQLRAIADMNGDIVRHALSNLLSSRDGVDADSAYSGIENYAFAQHDLYEVAEACTSVLMASLLDRRERWVRILALELLFWILGAYPIPPTSPDLRERCHRIAREGLWLLIREALGENRDLALEVLERLGEDGRARRLIEADS